jgi:hypothetical protein
MNLAPSVLFNAGSQINYSLQTELPSCKFNMGNILSKISNGRYITKESRTRHTLPNVRHAVHDVS